MQHIEKKNDQKTSILPDPLDADVEGGTAERNKAVLEGT